MRPLALLITAAVAYSSLAMERTSAAVFELSATNIVFDNNFGSNFPPFVTNTINGTITLSNSIAPGGHFSSADVTALSLDFFGLTGTLADVQADIAPGPVQLFGTLSADGKSFSVFNFGFSFGSATPVAGCEFDCAGNIFINSPPNMDSDSNFIAVDQFGNVGVANFTPQFTALASAVPELSTWAMMLLGFAGLGFVAHRRNSGTALIAA
jgi:hypothetical protein